MIQLSVGQTVLKHYVVEGLLEQAKTTLLYQASHQWLHNLVAVKLHIDPAAAQDLARFRRSAGIMARVRSPYVVSLLAHGLVYGAPCTVMELPRGATLRGQLAQGGPLPWPQAVELCSRMCMGLHDIHAAGVLHRNLQAETIMLVPGDEAFVKLVDLSLAKPIRPEARPVTTAGRSIGTLAYMSPEQLQAKQLDARSDIYAVGLILYELVTGALPEPKIDLPTLQRRVTSAPLPPVAAPDRPPLPPPLAQLVVRVLHPDREQRPRSARRLAGQLRSLKSAHAPANGALERDDLVVSAALVGKAADRPTGGGRPLRLVPLVGDGTRATALRTSAEESWETHDGHRIRGILAACIRASDLVRPDVAEWLARLMEGRGRCGRVGDMFWVATFTAASDDAVEHDMKFVKSCLVEHFWHEARVSSRLVDGTFQLSQPSLDGTAAPPPEMLEMLEAVAL